MKAMILCAGLGTRLKPWTEKHPKALFPVGGKPMLERVLDSLSNKGYDSFVVNVHHFADQIVGFIEKSRYVDVTEISDETEELLDTGGGILHAAALLSDNETTDVLIHNVDILTNADFSAAYRLHREQGNDATLICSHRESTRKLLKETDSDNIIGWRNPSKNQYRWKKEEFHQLPYDEVAFNGIYFISTNVLNALKRFGDKFSIMDYFLSSESKIGVYIDDEHQFIDIGKPGALEGRDVTNL